MSILLLRASSAPEDGGDHREVALTNPLGMCRAPLFLADVPTLMKEDDPNLPTQADRRRAIENLLGDHLDHLDPAARSRAADALLARLPRVVEVIRARRAESPWEDEVIGALRVIRDQLGFGMGELHSRYFVRRVLESEADQISPVRVGFGRTYSAGYDAAHAYVAGRLRERARHVCPAVFPEKIMLLEEF